MPLFEFFRVPKGKLDSIQLEKSGSGIDDLSSRTEDGLIELGWEDGQLLMQNHGSSSGSSRASKAQSLNLNNVDHDQDNLKVTKIENPDNFKGFPPSVELGTSRNDYAVPWLSNFLTQNDYNTYFTSESLDVNLGPQEKGSSFEANHDPLLSCNFTASGTTSPSYQLFPPMSFQSVSSFPSLGSQAIDSITTSELPGPSSSNKNDNMGLENFACFSKPFALMRSSIDKADGSVFSGVNGSRDKADLHVQNIMFGLSKSKVKPTEIIVGSSVNSGPLGKSFPAKAVDGEKKSDSCSVSSGNNVEGCPDEPRNNLKRKSHEAESSENPSEDVEDESESVKKQAPNRVTKGKRIRSAEVHNLSERKRRDRINEKMRVLQDLIPNCNKVDKASMLDEAIEYLKSLQFQLQIMTTGAGMYMSPMVRPTAMQPLMSGPSITVPNLPFYGLPGQGFPLAMSRPPFVPLAAYRDAEANVRRSCQITDSSRLMKQSKNQSADAQDINGSRGHDQNESLRH